MALSISEKLGINALPSMILLSLPSSVICHLSSVLSLSQSIYVLSNKDVSVVIRVDASVLWAVIGKSIRYDAKSLPNFWFFAY